MPDILLGFFKEFFESFLIGLRQKFEAVFAEQYIAQIALRALAFHNQRILALAGQVRIIAVKQDYVTVIAIFSARLVEIRPILSICMASSNR